MDFMELSKKRYLQDDVCHVIIRSTDRDCVTVTEQIAKQNNK